VFNKLTKKAAYYDMGIIVNGIAREQGVISILLLIILPVIILGSVIVYGLLAEKAEVNKAHKIAFACSEAYLSRHNSYLYNNFGILATLDNGGLESIVKYYFMRNNIVESNINLELNLTYETLGNPETFKNAIIDSSSNIVVQELTTYSISLLDQLELAEKMRGINQSLQNYEKKLSDQFDQTGATEILVKIKACDDVISGRKNVDVLKEHMDEKSKIFYENFQAIKNQIDKVSKDVQNPKESIAGYLSTKLESLKKLEESFLAQYHSFESATLNMEMTLNKIESEMESLNTIKNQIETLDASGVKSGIDNKMKIDKLKKEIKKYENIINIEFETIKNLSDILIQNNTTEKPSLLKMMQNMAYEVESMMSGIEIGSGKIDLTEEQKFSNKDFDQESTNLGIQALIDEYLIAVFDSYDQNCPRKIEYNNRHSEKRIIKGEIEYLISGIEIEKNSISHVRLKIFAIREVANIVTLLCNRDKMAQISNATVALPLPWRTVAFSAAIVAWSSVESYVDVNRLMKGEHFYFIKTSDQWKIDFDSLLSGGWKSSLNPNNIKTMPSKEDSNTKMTTVESSDKGPKSSVDIKDAVLDPQMYYLDYLRMLLLLQSESKTLLRAMDLMTNEIIVISNSKNNLEHFSRGHKVDVSLPKKEGVKRGKEDYTKLIFSNRY